MEETRTITLHITLTQNCEPSDDEIADALYDRLVEEGYETFVVNGTKYSIDSVMV